jgi:uncharacterized ferritin-like protein (DUF455 family)
MAAVEIKSFAESLLAAPTLAAKLAPPPPDLTDEQPGSPYRLRSTRPPELAILPRRKVKVPPLAGVGDPAQRGRILHALANHELQAAELFAWALLAFPTAPLGFRCGLVALCADEQRHCRMYLGRLGAHGVELGDYPVTGHFWHKIESLKTPLEFVCAMGLTFENANLDFCRDYARAARAAGDVDTAAVLDAVHRDEIGHVRFAWDWLARFKEPTTSPWDAYLAHIAWPLGPARARGKRFDAASRRAAGFDEDFIARLAATEAKRPGGAPRF